MKRVIEMFDVSSACAVRIAWPDSGEAQISFMADTGKRLSSIPASVVQLAASVAQDPHVLTDHARPVEVV